MTNHNYFHEDNLKLHPERLVIVGFIAADGCISVPKSGQRKICFNLCEKDKSVLDRINSEICFGARHIYPNRKTRSAMLSIPSDQLCKDLSVFGIVPRKTETFTLPLLPEPQMAYFLRGYFYGDGCVYGEGCKRRYHIIGTSSFCHSLRDYILSKGVVERASIYPAKNPVYANFEVSGRQAQMMSLYLFADNKMVLLQRKHVKTVVPVKATWWTKDEIKQIRNCSSFADVRTFCESTGRSYESAKTKRRQLITKKRAASKP
jgi:hypothetical protein